MMIFSDFNTENNSCTLDDAWDVASSCILQDLSFVFFELLADEPETVL